MPCHFTCRWKVQTQTKPHFQLRPQPKLLQNCILSFSHIRNYAETVIESTQPGHPSVSRRNEYRSKGGDALRLAVKADMVLFAGNTVWSISERVRGVCVDVLYKSTFTLFTLLYFTAVNETETEAKFPSIKHIKPTMPISDTPSWTITVRTVGSRSGPFFVCVRLFLLSYEFLFPCLTNEIAMI